MILCVTLNPAVDMTFFTAEITDVYRLEALKTTHIAGGKGNNAARVLKSLGESVLTFNPVGGLFGHMLQSLLTMEGIDNRAVWISGDTRQVVTLVNSGMEQRAIFAPPAKWKLGDRDAARAAFYDALEGCNAVCFCGSSPDRLVDGLYKEWIIAARERKILTLLDTYGPPLTLGVNSKPDILKINLQEAEGLLGRTLNTNDLQCDAILQIQETGIQQVVFTLGERGALFAWKGEVWAAYPPHVRVVNPIGTGDALGAGLLSGNIRGLQPLDCLRLGMAAAAADLTTWEAGRICAEMVSQLECQIEIIHL